MQRRETSAWGKDRVLPEYQVVLECSTRTTISLPRIVPLTKKSSQVYDTSKLSTNATAADSMATTLAHSETPLADSNETTQAATFEDLSYSPHILAFEQEYKSPPNNPHLFSALSQSVPVSSKNKNQELLDSLDQLPVYHRFSSRQIDRYSIAASLNTQPQTQSNDGQTNPELLALASLVLNVRFDETISSTDRIRDVISPSPLTLLLVTEHAFLLYLIAKPKLILKNIVTYRKLFAPITGCTGKPKNPFESDEEEESEQNEETLKKKMESNIRIIAVQKARNDVFLGLDNQACLNVFQITQEKGNAETITLASRIELEGNPKKLLTHPTRYMFVCVGESLIEFLKYKHEGRELEYLFSLSTPEGDAKQYHLFKNLVLVLLAAENLLCLIDFDRSEQCEIQLPPPGGFTSFRVLQNGQILLMSDESRFHTIGLFNEEELESEIIRLSKLDPSKTKVPCRIRDLSENPIPIDYSGSILLGNSRFLAYGGDYISVYHTQSFQGLEERSVNPFTAKVKFRGPVAFPPTDNDNNEKEKERPVQPLKIGKITNCCVVAKNLVAFIVGEKNVRLLTVADESTQYPDIKPAKHPMLLVQKRYHKFFKMEQQIREKSPQNSDQVFTAKFLKRKPLEHEIIVHVLHRLLASKGIEMLVYDPSTRDERSRDYDRAIRLYLLGTGMMFANVYEIYVQDQSIIDLESIGRERKRILKREIERVIVQGLRDYEGLQSYAVEEDEVIVLGIGRSTMDSLRYSVLFANTEANKPENKAYKEILLMILTTFYKSTQRTLVKVESRPFCKTYKIPADAFDAKGVMRYKEVANPRVKVGDFVYYQPKGWVQYAFKNLFEGVENEGEDKEKDKEYVFAYHGLRNMPKCVENDRGGLGIGARELKYLREFQNMSDARSGHRVGYGLNLAARIEVIESLFCEIVKINYEKKEQIINVALMSRVRTSGIKVPVFETTSDKPELERQGTGGALSRSVSGLNNSVYGNTGGAHAGANAANHVVGGANAVAERYIVNDPLLIRPVGIMIKTASDLDPLNMGIGCRMF